MFHYDFELVRTLDEEGRELVMCMDLGALTDKFQTAMDALDAQVRKEVHGD